MAKVRRKKVQCLNCGGILPHEANYCPACGQENNDKKVSIRQLLSDFWFDYFNVDSKITRTAKTLLFAPGKLTNEYNLGRRVSYLTPAKLYFYVSVLYFLVLSFTHADFLDASSIKWGGNGEPEITISTEGIEKTTTPAASTIDPDSAANPTAEELLKMVRAEQAELKDDQFFQEYFLAQVAKFLTSDTKSIGEHFLNAMSSMMFLLLPLFAAIVMLFNYKKEKLYIEHLVFGLHLHSFIFVVFGISILLGNYLVDVPSIVPVTLVAIYTIAAMRKVYLVSIWKSARQLIGILFLYCFSGIFVFLLTVFVYFLLY